MSGSQPRRRRGFGLHPEIGRRYERADLTAHRLRNPRQRRRTLLIERVTAVLVAYYARELEVDAADVQDFANEVAHRLRSEIQADWTLDRAERRAFEIAEELFRELGADGDATDSNGGPPSEPETG